MVTGGVIMRGCANGSCDCQGALLDLGQTADGVITRGCDIKWVDIEGGDTDNKGYENKGCVNV